MKFVLRARLVGGSVVFSDVFYCVDELSEFFSMIDSDPNFKIDGKLVVSYDVYACIGSGYSVQELPF